VDGGAQVTAPVRGQIGPRGRARKKMRRRTRGMMHSRTMWFSLALVILGVVYDNFSYVSNLIDPRLYGVLLILIGITVAVLRFVTTTSLDDR
jgi:hypothetical protein